LGGVSLTSLALEGGQAKKILELSFARAFALRCNNCDFAVLVLPHLSRAPPLSPPAAIAPATIVIAIIIIISSPSHVLGRKIANTHQTCLNDFISI
jgi:hypothetical protein